VKEYDLEIRTERFAESVRAFVRGVDKDLANVEDCKQLVRSSGSIAANCIEANEGFSKKDRAFRFKVCRKEARESRLWLNLIYTTGPELISEKARLIDEATQLSKIFSAIVRGIGGTDKEQNG
jgi:four helix bundle protein